MNQIFTYPVILLVEDNTFQRKALMHQLNSLGYDKLLEAQNGEAALALCQQYSVNILFCDLRMPGMDGMELLRHLSLNGFRGDIILSSALAPELIVAVRRMCKAYGLHVLGVLVKPTSLSQISSLLECRVPNGIEDQLEPPPIITVEELGLALEQGEIVPGLVAQIRELSSQVVI